MKKKIGIGIIVVCLVAGTILISSLGSAGTSTKTNAEVKESTSNMEEESTSKVKDITVEKSLKEIDADEFKKEKSDVEKLEADPQEGKGAEQGEAAGSTKN